ncbi:uncharacterized protein LOC128860211 isoform X1 [Anastrepha ludens]|uniref:uncharacterized protein LOC128860211 isoform X1 n=1 Tax=Anastrepha ludens TaxID=28586 RepID=UPI0023AFE69E|nr:uncharacterized protein LOC128860211 isoform X1 [Anastrepha ludens]
MEKVVEIYLGDCNKRRIFHATSQQATTTIATSKEQKQTQKYYYTKSKIHKNYNSNTNRRHNENRGQQQTQQSKHRQKRTSCQQQYYAQNAATTGTSQKQQQQQQQLQPQLTPTVDYFRFSALYALVATSATAAAYHMRDAYACVTAYDEVNDDSDSDCEDDNGGNSGGTPHHHNTRQRHITDATTTMELKRSRTSLIQPQLSKLLRAACLRNGNGVRHATSIGVGTDGAGGASSCGLFNAIGTATGSGTSFVGSGFDTRSIFYLTLVFFIYCGVMMRASVAATALANATHNNNNSDSNENNAPTAATNMTPNSASIENVQTKTVRDLITSVRASPSTTSGNASALSLSSPVSNFTTDIVNNSRKVSSLAVTEASPAVLVGKDERLAKMQRVVKRDTAHVPDDEDDSAYHDDEFDEYEALINNRSAKGKYIGAPCFSNMTCETSLLHVTCEKETKTCGCEKNYPVQLGLTKGCDKPKKLGEQCFYDETCMYNDENSLCVQVRHNAICQCAHGFHSVSHTKPTRRIFCTKDLKELNSDLPTLLGVTTGIAVLAGLICMVLHLFSKTKYPRPRNFGDANLPPPIMYSSDTVQSGRPSSRSSLRSSGSIGSYGNRRASSGGATTGGGHGVGISGGGSSGTKGILVSTSRTGAARSAAILLISCHLTEIAKEAAIRTTTSRQASGAGCSANSRDNLDDNGSGGATTAGTTGGSGTRSCDSTLSMTRHLQKQLNHQRHLLSLELSPAKSKNNDRIRTLLGINGIDNYRTDDDDELNSLDHNHLQIGALPTPASETPRFAAHPFSRTQAVCTYYTTQLVSRKKFRIELVVNAKCISCTILQYLCIFCKNKKKKTVHKKLTRIHS